MTRRLIAVLASAAAASMRDRFGSPACATLRVESLERGAGCLAVDPEAAKPQTSSGTTVCEDTKSPLPGAESRQ